MGCELWGEVNQGNEGKLNKKQEMLRSELRGLLSSKGKAGPQECSACSHAVASCLLSKGWHSILTWPFYVTLYRAGTTRKGPPPYSSICSVIQPYTQIQCVPIIGEMAEPVKALLAKPEDPSSMTSFHMHAVVCTCTNTHK